MLPIPGPPALSDSARAEEARAHPPRQPECHRALRGVRAFRRSRRRPLDARRAQPCSTALLAYGPRRSRAPAARRGRCGCASCRASARSRRGRRRPPTSRASAGSSQVRRIERGVAYAVHRRGRRSRARCTPRLHDRMTESVLDARRRQAAAAVPDASRPRRSRRVDVLGAGPGRARARRPRARPGALDRRDRLPAAKLPRARPQPDRRRADDVRAGQLRALPPQDLQRRVRSSTASASRARCSQMIKQHHRAEPGRRAQRLQRQRRGDRGQAPAARFFPDPSRRRLPRARTSRCTSLMKVETHNHPTAISPFPGAATGSGGEIRDEGATGRGGKPKAGLTGFSVSDLHLPGLPRPWERAGAEPERIASALEIMLDGPLGGAAFNNEFGRPNLLGYFRSFELEVHGRGGREVRGYHKPIMIAGGLGNIRARARAEERLPVGAPLIVLGGPAMRIGLGGGAASSLASGASSEELDFASVQRDNAEMQRRCQEVIDRCWALGDDNPIAAIHDVGAGGLSNALPELVHESGRGARARAARDARTTSRACRRSRSGATRRRSATCSACIPSSSRAFAALCARERCPFAVVGDDHRRRLAARSTTSAFGNAPVDMPLAVLLGKPPKMRARRRSSVRRKAERFDLVAGRARRGGRARAAPADRRGQDVPDHDRRPHRRRPVRRAIRWSGPWQVPVADAAVTAARLRRLHRRSDGDGRARAARAARRGGVGAHGGGRGDHQHRVGARSTRSSRRQAQRQLDGRGRSPGRRRAALRRGARGRHGAVPGARHRDPGRQGLAQHAHASGSEDGERAA